METIYIDNQDLLGTGAYIDNANFLHNNWSNIIQIWIEDLCIMERSSRSVGF